MCVLVCALGLYPAIPGWGSWCVCLGTGFGFHPAHPGWGVGVCVCVRAPPVPRQSWLGCAVWVCVLGLGFRLRPAISSWGVGVCVLVCAPRLYLHNRGRDLWCVCVGSGFGFHPANPGSGVGACVFMCALCLYPAITGSGVRWGCVCLGLGFGCALPFLAAVLGCVCLCARSASTPPILAEVRGVCALRQIGPIGSPPRAGLLDCGGRERCRRAAGPRPSKEPPLGLGGGAGGRGHQARHVVWRRGFPGVLHVLHATPHTERVHP